MGTLTRPAAHGPACPLDSLGSLPPSPSTVQAAGMGCEKHRAGHGPSWFVAHVTICLTHGKPNPEMLRFVAGKEMTQDSQPRSCFTEQPSKQTGEGISDPLP